MRLTHKRATRKHLSPLPEEQSNDDDILSNDDNSYDRSSEEPKSRQSKRSASESTEQSSDEEEEEFASEVIHSSTMTKRQRAKYQQHDDSHTYLELPIESNKKKNLTQEEQALKRSEVARRRKNQSAQRAEKDKADTINRLLKKQATKSKRVIKDVVDSNPSATPPPSDNVRYTTTTDGSQLSLPDSLIDELLVSSMHRPVPRKVACEINGCKNDKKYVAKASGKAVCSLEHYRLAERA